MKTTFLLILSTLLLGCYGQQPDIECYSTGKVDSLLFKIDSLEKELIKKDSAVAWQADIIGKRAYIFKADTLRYSIEGLKDSTKINIDRKGPNVWVEIIYGLNRINVNYVDGNRKAVFMYDNYTEGQLYLKE